MDLKFFRKQNKLTQADVAKVISVAPTTYLGYEKGTSEPSLETLCKLADLYQISLDELIGRDFAQAGTELEDEILKQVRHLSILEQGKVLGYAKARVEAQSEIKDIKIKTGYRG